MEITYLGHSSFRLKGKTAIVVCDPFDPKVVGFKFPRVSADIVTISHQHDDHNNAELVDGVKKIVDGPGEYEILDVSIVGIASGKNTIYVIEMDGIRLAHLGDLDHVITSEQASEIGAIDILFIGVKKAVDTVYAIAPKVIIPMFSSLESVDPFLAQMELKVEKLPKFLVKEGELVRDDQKIILLEKK